MACVAPRPARRWLRPGVRSPNKEPLEFVRMAVFPWSSTGMVWDRLALFSPSRQSRAPSATHHRQASRTAADGRDLPDGSACLPHLVPAVAGRSGPAGFLSADSRIIVAPLEKALARTAL